MVVGEGKEKFTRMSAYANQEWAELAYLLAAMPKHTLPMLMPNLDTIIIGEYESRAWTPLLESEPGSIRQMEEMQRIELGMFLVNLRPLIICTHTAWSPYAPRFIASTPSEKTVMVCKDHYERFEAQLFLLLPSRVNREYYDPRFNIWRDVYSESVEDSLHAMVHTTNRWGEGRDNQPYIELMGYSTLPESATDDLAVQRRIHAPDIALPKGTPQDNRAKDEKLAGKLMDVIDDKVHPKWKGHFTVLPWNKIPPCEGCGWTKDDAYYDAKYEMLMEQEEEETNRSVSNS